MNKPRSGLLKELNASHATPPPLSLLPHQPANQEAIPVRSLEGPVIKWASYRVPVFL